MRKATIVILSVGMLLGFACTGEDDGAGAPGHDDGGEAGATAGLTGGGKGGEGGGAAHGGSGNAGSSGNASGGAAGAGGGGDEGGAAGSGGGAGAGMAGSGGASGEAGGGPLPSILLFSRTLGYRHESIPDAVSALAAIASDHDWASRSTEDPTLFSDAGLAPFNVVVFLCTSGDVLDTEEEAAFERFVRAGGGFVGIHSASDTEYDWPFYGELVGAYFREHPPIQEAVLHVENATHPSTAALPATLMRTDEWYAFDRNPRENVTVLLTLDEASYAPGTATMGTDHPIAWFHEVDGGRAFYTALGHTRESYTEPAFLAHVTGALEWAAGR